MLSESEFSALSVSAYASVSVSLCRVLNLVPINTNFCLCLHVHFHPFNMPFLLLVKSSSHPLSLSSMVPRNIIGAYTLCTDVQTHA